MNLIFKKHQITVIKSFREAATLNGERILVYFPHGLGDWVMFNSIVQFLSKNNEVFLTCFGDDYVSIQEGSIIKPAYSGINNPHTEDGSVFSKLHFNFKGEMELTSGLSDFCSKNNASYFYYEAFYEGSLERPFHSKARGLLRSISSLMTENEKQSLKTKLPNLLNPSADPFVTNFVSSRLSSYTNYTYDSKLILISRYGLTSTGKNWGHLFRNDKYINEGDEAREFVDLCLKKNSKSFFITMESEGVVGTHSLVDHSKNTFSYHELFGSSKEHRFLPFAIVLKSLLSMASLHVGVPTGTMGVASLYENLFCINLWIELFPSRYFEPKENEVNLISSDKVSTRKSSHHGFDSYENIKYNNHYLPEQNINGDSVFNFAEASL